MVATFPTVAAAGDAVSRAVADGLVPSLLEIMDAASIRAVEAHTGTPVVGEGETPAAILIGQSDLGGEPAHAEMERLEACCEVAGAEFCYVTGDLAEARMLLQARRDVLPSLEVLGNWLTDDLCVPRTAIATLITACEEIAADTGMLIAVVGHAGDGNMHPTMVYDGSDADAVRRAWEAYDRVLSAGRALGGTITGEHGVGRMKQAHLAGEIGPVGLSVHRAIKRALDPEGLFNPGSMFAME
jgi:FAD/FMN-containing dehydrogenase